VGCLEVRPKVRVRDEDGFVEQRIEHYLDRARRDAGLPFDRRAMLSDLGVDELRV